jgi:hypothetical protein
MANRNWLWRTLGIVLVTFIGSAFAQGNPSVTAERVSMIQLIATPERFNNKQVNVVGFLNLEFEGDALWTSKADFEAVIPGNAILFEVPKKLSAEQRKQLSGHFVIVVGKFKALGSGQKAIFAGVLTDVVRVDLWKSRDEIEKLLHPQNQ